MIKNRENQLKLKHALMSATHCDIQHDGWPCGTCFFALSQNYADKPGPLDWQRDLDNRDWQTLLWFRGDYQEQDLDNLPALAVREAILDDIYNLSINF